MILNAKKTLLTFLLINFTLLIASDKGWTEKEKRKTQHSLKKLAWAVPITGWTTLGGPCYTIYSPSSQTGYWFTGLSLLSFVKSFLSYKKRESELQSLAYKQAKDTQNLAKYAKYIQDFKDIVNKINDLFPAFAISEIINLLKEKKSQDPDYIKNVSHTTDKLLEELSILKAARRIAYEKDEIINDYNQVWERFYAINTLQEISSRK